MAVMLLAPIVQNAPETDLTPHMTAFLIACITTAPVPVTR